MKASTRENDLHLPLLETVAARHNSGASDACNGQRQACGLFWKTQLCSKWKATGKCPKKDQCSFAHSLEELRDLPNLRCTKWCRHVFRGLPCEDSNCPYAHSRDQLRCNSHQLLAFKTALCKFHAKGMCLSGEACRSSTTLNHLPAAYVKCVVFACGFRRHKSMANNGPRFAHTLKELRSSAAGTVCVAEADEQLSQRPSLTPQPPVHQNRANAKTSARKSGGSSSQIYRRNQKTACCHDTSYGGASMPQGYLECIRQFLPFEETCARKNTTASSTLAALSTQTCAAGSEFQPKNASHHFTAMRPNDGTPKAPNTKRNASFVNELSRSPGRYRQPLRAANMDQKQQSTKRKQDNGDAQGLSTCEATEALAGVTSSSSSRTSSRSSSKSSAAITAKSERHENIPRENALTQRGSQSAIHSQKIPTVRDFAQSEQEEELQRAAFQVTDFNNLSNEQTSCPLQGGPCPVPNFENTKKAEVAPDAEVYKQETIHHPSFHPATLSTSVLSGAPAVMAGLQTSRSYTKTQLLAISLSSEQAMQLSAGLEVCESRGRADDAHIPDLTFRLMSCEEDGSYQLAAESAHSQDPPARAMGRHSNETLKRSQRTWPSISTLPEVPALGKDVDHSKSCNVQSFSRVSSCARPAARFRLAAQTLLPDHISNLKNHSPCSPPALCIRRKVSAQNANTRKGRHALRPAFRFETRTQCKILSEARKPITRLITSANVAPYVYPADLGCSTSVPETPRNRHHLESLPSIMPPPDLLLYTQALEAAAVASVACELPLNEIKYPDVVTSEAKLKALRKAADVSSPTYVETWDLHAKSMALMALAALCRLALLPPQQPETFEGHPSTSSSPYHVMQQPLEPLVALNPLTELNAQMGILQNLADGSLLTNTNLATTVERCNVGVDGTTLIQRAFEEEPRLAKPSDNPLHQQCASHEERSLLTSNITEYVETTKAEQQCAGGCVTMNLNTGYSPSRDCPRCLFLAALREHQPLLQHTDMSASPLNPLDNFFQRIASGYNTAALNTADSSGASASKDEEQHPPPPELVASLLQYVKVASDLQQARVF